MAKFSIAKENENEESKKVLEIKVIEEETVDFNNTLLSKPIEDRQEIADHITHQPLTVNIKFVITGFSAEDDYNTLIEMYNSNQIYEYEGVHGLYNNMAIKSLTIPKDVKIANGFEGSLKIQQIQVVEQKSVQIAVGIDPATKNQAQENNNEPEKRELEQDEIKDKSSLMGQKDD